MRLKRLKVLMILICASILIGCTSSAATNSNAIIKPISDIVKIDPAFTNITSDSAMLLAKTTQPVVCAVVYGTTSAYGQIATDQDMAGGAHTDHHPTLSGLHPDTTYFARLQGVDASGTLYRSTEYTFHTLLAFSNNTQPNLASLKNGASIVGVSSNYGGGANDSSFGALNAIDGNPATQWSSNGDGDKAWIEIALAATTHVTRIGFWTRTMGSSAQIQSFQIVTDKGETLGPFSLSDANQIFYFDTDFTAKQLRFEVVKSSGGNTGAVEIEVYGEARK
jgi:hypothetical protein